MANNSSPPLTCGDERDLALPDLDHRSRRYLRRAGLWHLSTLPRLKKCGCCRTGATVALRLVGDVAGFAGLQSCGSVWVCPVCSAKIAARRRLEIQAAIAAWLAVGGRVAFSTFTMRHHAGHGLVRLWDALSGSWGSVTSGRSWQLTCARFELLGWLRLTEVTHGRNGWHVHIHALLFLPARTTSLDVVKLHSWMFGRWDRALRRRGFDAVAAAQDSHLIDAQALEAVADYFAKNTDTGGPVPGGDGRPAGGGSGAAAGGPAVAGTAADAVALEFTRSHTKGVRSSLSTAPPFTLLDRIFGEGDADALDLWHEWEKGSKGRRQLGWSALLRERLGLLEEKSDEDIAGEELGSSDDTLVLITGEGWARMIREPVLIPALLTVTDAGGLVAALDFLQRHRIAYEMPGEGVT
jgi:hypothetical protein